MQLNSHINVEWQSFSRYADALAFAGRYWTVVTTSTALALPSSRRHHRRLLTPGDVPRLYEYCLAGHHTQSDHLKIRTIILSGDGFSFHDHSPPSSPLPISSFHHCRASASQPAGKTLFLTVRIDCSSCLSVLRQRLSLPILPVYVALVLCCYLGVVSPLQAISLIYFSTTHSLASSLFSIHEKSFSTIASPYIGVSSRQIYPLSSILKP